MRRVLAALLLLAAPAAAQPSLPDVVTTGTLRAILDRGAIRLGVRQDAVPFAFANRAGQPVGFSVDLCMGVAADVAAALSLDLLDADAPAWRTGLRVVTVPVAPDQRLPKVIAGDIDLECGSTTATAERMKTVAFSPVFFLAGTRLMVGLDSGIAAARDLGGKTVAVSSGTTNAEVVGNLAKLGTPPFTVTQTAGIPAAYALLQAGTVAAVASDDVLLAGLRATGADGARFIIVGDFLSFEPYALILRKDDPAFASLVDASFRRMAAAGTLRVLYKRWFTDRLPGGQTLSLPMSPQLNEMLRALGDPD